MANMDREKMICPCCGRVFPTDKGGVRYCPLCIRYCDGNGCYVAKERPKPGGPYILKEGGKPGVAIYSRCEDPLFARAELLLTMEATPKDKACFGFYDVDPTFSIEEFLKAYVGDKKLEALLEKLKLLRQNGWLYRRGD